MGAQFWLSLVMGVVGITGIFIAGKGRWQGWLIGLLVQPVWIAFFVVTEAWPGIILPLGYGWVYGKNLLAWRREERMRGGDEMGFTKHGHGDVLKEDGDLAKEGKSIQDEALLEALAEENAVADK